MSDSFYLGQRQGRGLALIQRSGRTGMELAHTVPNDGQVREQLNGRWGHATHPYRQTTNSTVNTPLSPRAQSIRYYDADHSVRDLINGSAVPAVSSRRNVGDTQKTPLVGGAHDPIHTSSVASGSGRHASFGNTSLSTDPRRGRHNFGPRGR